MKRFNLWEKIVIENEEFENLETEEETEEEIQDTLQELMINFILNLPEDSVPEDMRSNYDTIVSQIGDEYLGNEEVSDYDGEDFDEPKFDDGELMKDKESVSESRIQFTVELPSGTRIVLKNDAERKRATAAIKYYNKGEEKIGDKELMRFISLAIKMKGVNLGEVKKAFEGVTKDQYAFTKL